MENVVAAKLLELAQTLADRYGALPAVAAVALGGSLAAGWADPGSDIDLYVYAYAEIPLAAREETARARARVAEVNNQFWESGDEWIEASAGVHVDVTFRATTWIAGELRRLLTAHQASVGYSTCLWHNVKTSRALYDCDGWFAELQAYVARDYPEALRRAIVAKNYPILRQTLSSYRYQLAGAVARGDDVSCNHRIAAVLASYFDIVFAVNRVLHPGEKRLVEIAEAECADLPAEMRAHVTTLVASITEGDVLARLDALVAGLEALLRAEALLDVEEGA